LPQNEKPQVEEPQDIVIDPVQVQRYEQYLKSMDLISAGLDDISAIDPLQLLQIAKMHQLAQSQKTASQVQEKKVVSETEQEESESDHENPSKGQKLSGLVKNTKISPRKVSTSEKLEREKPQVNISPADRPNSENIGPEKPCALNQSGHSVGKLPERQRSQSSHGHTSEREDDVILSVHDSPKEEVTKIVAPKPSSPRQKPQIEDSGTRRITRSRSRSMTKKPSRKRRRDSSDSETETPSAGHSRKSRVDSVKKSDTLSEADRIKATVQRVASLLRSKNTVAKISAVPKGKQKKSKSTVPHKGLVIEDFDSENEAPTKSGDSSKSSDASVMIHRDQVEKIVQNMLKRSKIRVVDSDGDEEDKDFPNRRELLEKFHVTLHDTISDIPQVKPKENLHRTTDFGMTKVKDPKSIPVHPSINDTFKACMESVKTDSMGDTLGIGKWLTNTRGFPARLYEPGDQHSLHKPQKASTSDLLPNVKASLSSFSDKELQSQEQSMREMSVLWSQNIWGMQAIDTILCSDLEADEAFDRISHINNQLKAVAPLIQDRISVILSNTVLRRRDLVLRQYPCTKYKRDSIVDLRASPLTDEKLFVIPPELKEKEDAEKTSRDMIAAINRPVTVHLAGQNQYQNQAKQNQNQTNQPKANDNQQGQAFQQPSTSTGYAGARNFKKQRNRGNAYSFRGNYNQNQDYSSNNYNTRGRGRGGRDRGRGSRSRSNNRFRGRANYQ
jgi:hypothetical protein